MHTLCNDACSIPVTSFAFTRIQGFLLQPMRIANFEFKPAIWPSLAALLLIPLLVSLGVWQLSRAHEKEQRLFEYEQRNSDTTVLADNNRLFDLTTGYKQVRITGHYLIGQSFLLDNQVQNSRVGYHVFTPLQLDDQRLILINRGWIALGTSRENLPEIPTPETEVVITGVLSPAPGHGILLGDDIQTNKLWPRVVLAIILPRLASELNAALAPQIILLDPAATDGFVREWKIVQFGPERNYGYAFQWFTMAIVVLIIFIVLNTRRINHAADSGESQP